MLKVKKHSAKSDCFDRLYHHKKKSETMSAAPYLGATFTPQISEYARKKHSNQKNNKDRDLFRDLYQQALSSSRKKEERRQKMLEQEMAECTFKPKIGREIALPHKRVAARKKKNHSKPMVSRIGDKSRSETELETESKAPQRKGEFMTTVTTLQHFISVVQQLQQTMMPDVSKVSMCDIDCKVDIDASITFCCICRGGEEEGDQLIQLSSCQHCAHLDCLRQQLQARWSGKKISFNYLQCGECRTPLAHDALFFHLIPHLQLKHKVEALCLQQAQADGIIEDFEKKMAENVQDTMNQCMSTLSCYLCAQCSEPFCGGRVDCADDDALDLSALCCPSCKFKSTKDGPTETKSNLKAAELSNKWRGKCQIHGYAFAIYKCDSCCSVATWDCRSNHYCERCHNMASSKKDFKCPGIKKCPLGIDHPPNKAGVHGEVDNGFVIGCSKCFLGEANSKGFVLASDSSAREYGRNWEDRF